MTLIVIMIATYKTLNGLDSSEATVIYTMHTTIARVLRRRRRRRRRRRSSSETRGATGARRVACEGWRVTRRRSRRLGAARRLLWRRRRRRHAAATTAAAAAAAAVAATSAPHECIGVRTYRIYSVVWNCISSVGARGCCRPAENNRRSTTICTTLHQSHAARRHTRPSQTNHAHFVSSFSFLIAFVIA